jgi:DNA-directed RNA polymerase subunit RPC12/RpoP
MLTMTAASTPTARTEIACRDCGSLLAEMVPDRERGGFQVLPTALRPAVQVFVAGRRLLRCPRCRGRVLIDQVAA